MTKKKIILKWADEREFMWHKRHPSPWRLANTKINTFSTQKATLKTVTHRIF